MYSDAPTYSDIVRYSAISTLESSFSEIGVVDKVDVRWHREPKIAFVVFASSHAAGIAAEVGVVELQVGLQCGPSL